MWRPQERIRWKPDPGRWPSAVEAARSRLFSPIKVGPCELEQRTWVPAMVPWRASEEGFVTPQVLAWYERFAQGRPGAIVVEATGIRDIPSGPLLRIGDDRFIDGLTQLVERVRTASSGHTRVFIQLIDFLAIRRRPEPGKFFTRFLRITKEHRRALGLDDDAPEERVRALLAELPESRWCDVLSAREYEDLTMGYRERVTDTHLPHIAELPKVLPDLFAAAACRAEKAGFDGVELHYAHAYTMASFLSALNTREDGYGGAMENRIRLPIEVFEAVRGAVGADFAVGCRMLTEDCVEGGSGLAETSWFASRLATAGIDFISLSRGGRFEDAARPRVGEAAYPYTGPSGYECMPQYISDARGPFERNVPSARTIRRAVRAAGHATPIVVAGGIHGFAQAERILREGDADIVALARQSLADPDWFEKVRTGHGREVRLCEYTNYCEALDQKHKPVTCKLWDRLDLDEPGTPRTPDGRRRLVAPPWGGRRR
ncbi:MAG: NADH:flavin oxidoreductase [Alphaproteobacteria bacterium]|nr:MAG: NADH:flavin oxidoreductase [Alphaproteobacteria bacterium]